ncbi:MAG: CAP domain-containing protein [Phycisphaerae bacterium]|nr:CAP domain-containing protein [Phycisphaerae bacterium]MDW8261427.1 CAP domain-containing protein [Phycisphaerales bacterium]
MSPGVQSLRFIETLSPRRLLAAAYPTALEQYMVELINRARSDPAGEAARFGIDLNEGLAPGTLSAAARQPLAINPFLTDAARSHVEWLLANNLFQHEGAGGSTPADRIQAAGYPTGTSWGFAENLAIMGPVTQSSRPASIATLHRSLFVDAGIAGRGHRLNLLNGAMKEIGSGVAYGSFRYQSGGSFVSQLAGQKFAYSGSGVFLTGVAYSDSLTDDDFYTVGEALAGVTVVARRADGASFQTTTWDSGGYSLAVPPGTYTVTAFGGALGGTVVHEGVVVGSQNVKRDFRPDMVRPFASLTGGVLTVNGTPAGDVIDIALSGSSYEASLNGASLRFDASAVMRIEIFAADGNDRVDASPSLVPVYLLGGAGNDTLIGGAAHDTLTGGGGRDALTGNAGNDRLSGHVHHDTLIGGDGDDRLYGDDGDDLLCGNGGVDRLWGGEGDDTLEGGSSNDRLFGDAGSDRLHGGNHNDFLDGGTGPDQLFGDSGNDSAILDPLDTLQSVETLL